jgi:hypothetical protein
MVDLPCSPGRRAAPASRAVAVRQSHRTGRGDLAGWGEPDGSPRPPWRVRRYGRRRRSHSGDEPWEVQSSGGAYRRQVRVPGHNSFGTACGLGCRRGRRGSGDAILVGASMLSASAAEPSECSSICGESSHSSFGMPAGRHRAAHGPWAGSRRTPRRRRAAARPGRGRRTAATCRRHTSHVPSSRCPRQQPGPPLHTGRTRHTATTRTRSPTVGDATCGQRRDHGRHADREEARRGAGAATAMA